MISSFQHLDMLPLPLLPLFLPELKTDVCSDEAFHFFNFPSTMDILPAVVHADCKTLEHVCFNSSCSAISDIIDTSSGTSICSVMHYKTNITNTHDYCQIHTYFKLSVFKMFKNNISIAIFLLSYGNI